MHTSDRMPVLFVGHGSPMNAIGENTARKSWIEKGKILPRPRVIIAISAHWQGKEIYVRTADTNKQINDMYGFPKELYEVHYEPASSPADATHILTLLEGIATLNNDWGIDHGIWSVLSNMFPLADIPVVMVSVSTNVTPNLAFEVGKRLSSLRDEGAMIFASGNVVHNLRMVSWDMDGGYPFADTFDKTIRDAILKNDFDTPLAYTQIPDFSLSVPTVDHYYPLLSALGAVRKDDKVEVWNDYRELGSISMTSYTWENKTGT